MAQDFPVVPRPPALATVLSAGGTADAGDVLRNLSGGRPARTPDGVPLRVYETSAEAVRDATAYLRARAMSFVRFGLDAGEFPGGAEVLTGPVVELARRLAVEAPPRRLWVSAAVRDLLADEPVALEPAGPGYQLQV